MMESDSLPETVHVAVNSGVMMAGVSGGSGGGHELPQGAGELSVLPAEPVTNEGGASLSRCDTRSSEHSRSGLAKLAIRHEVLHSLQEAVVVVGRDEIVELYNEAAFQLWGFPEDTVIGAHYGMLLGRDVDISPSNKSRSRILTKDKVCMPTPLRFPSYSASCIGMRNPVEAHHGTRMPIERWDSCSDSTTAKVATDSSTSTHHEYISVH